MAALQHRDAAQGVRPAAELRRARFAVICTSRFPSTRCHFEQVQGSPFELHRPSRFQMRMCFDPLAHVLAFAEMFNQTVTWEDWQPIGIAFRCAPRSHLRRGADHGGGYRNSRGGEILPAGLFTIPSDEPDMGEPEDDGDNSAQSCERQAGASRHALRQSADQGRRWTPTAKSIRQT